MVPSESPWLWKANAQLGNSQAKVLVSPSGGQLRSCAWWETPNCLWAHPALGAVAVCLHSCGAQSELWCVCMSGASRIHNGSTTSWIYVQAIFLTSSSTRLRMLLAYLPTIKWKLPCLSRSTKIFFDESQHSHGTRSILFSILTADQMPEFIFSIYRYFCSSSYNKGTYLHRCESFTSRCK